MKNGMLIVLALSLSACGATSMKKADMETTSLFATEMTETDKCKIMYHDFATGLHSETEYMAKEEAVKRIKDIKKLPGFSKPQTDQWLSCRLRLR